MVKLVLGYIYYGHLAADNMPATRKNPNMHLIQKVQQISRIGICGLFMYSGWLKNFILHAKFSVRKSIKMKETVTLRHLHHINLSLHF